MGKGEVDDRYTQDGTIDLTGNPCVKKETGSWKACPYILGNEGCERLAYYGMSTNLVIYMVGRMGEGVATAANNVTNWAGTCYITPLIGAFFADSYLGRFWTISIFMMVYVLVSPSVTLQGVLNSS